MFRPAMENWISLSTSLEHRWRKTHLIRGRWGRRSTLKSTPCRFQEKNDGSSIKEYFYHHSVGRRSRQKVVFSHMFKSTFNLCGSGEGDRSLSGATLQQDWPGADSHMWLRYNRYRHLEQRSTDESWHPNDRPSPLLILYTPPLY